MTVYLNEDTFRELDWEDAQVMRQFFSLCRSFGVKHVEVGEDCLPYLYKTLRLNSFSMDIKNKMRSLFIRQSALSNSRFDTVTGLRCNGNYFVIEKDGCSEPLSGRKFAWSYFNGGILVGLSKSKYGDSFKFQVNEHDKANSKLLRQFSSYMVSVDAHLNEPVLKRWLYAYKSCGDIDFAKVQTQENNLVQFPPDYIKHFSHKGLSKNEWLKSTQSHKLCKRDKTHGVAKFIAGIQKDSFAYAYLVSSIMRTAFENQLYEECAQNGFAVDVGCVIGAANGKETRAIVLYVTSVNAVHIRPYECKAKVCALEIGEKLKQYL